MAPPVTLVTATAGFVLSTSMSLAAAEALALPAWSVHVPAADWFAPSPNVIACVHAAMPDPPASVPLKLTTTSVLFQPLPFAAGARLAVAVG